MCASHITTQSSATPLPSPNLSQLIGQRCCAAIHKRRYLDTDSSRKINTAFNRCLTEARAGREGAHQVVEDGVQGRPEGQPLPRLPRLQHVDGGVELRSACVARREECPKGHRVLQGAHHCAVVKDRDVAHDRRAALDVPQAHLYTPCYVIIHA